MGKKGVDQIVEMLVSNNVKLIYAVTGHSLNELNDAVRRIPLSRFAILAL